MQKIYDETAYVAYGVDEKTDPSGSNYWIAVWSDDGPQSEEKFARSLPAARSIAEAWAREAGLEAVQVDELGPLPRQAISRDKIIRGIQDYCADLLEQGSWNEADAMIVAGMFIASGDPWSLFVYMDERTGAWDVGYETRDGREWFPILRQMRNRSGSGLLEAFGDYDIAARTRALA